jgi:hypothetical protein
MRGHRVDVVNDMCLFCSGRIGSSSTSSPEILPCTRVGGGTESYGSWTSVESEFFRLSKVNGSLLKRWRSGRAMQPTCFSQEDRELLDGVIQNLNAIEARAKTEPDYDRLGTLMR